LTLRYLSQRLELIKILTLRVSMSRIYNAYGVGQALIPVFPAPLPFENPPTTNNDNFDIGQLVYTPPLGPTSFYIYAGAGVWDQLTIAGVGIVNSLTGTANQIAVSTPTGAVILSIPATFIAPGTIASIGGLTGGTGITATTGNIAASAGNVTAFGTVTGGTGVIATTGNLTASGIGSGLLLTPTVVGAGASPQTANGRSGQVTFSGVSIAAGATQSFVINNTSIAATGTVILYGMTGATAGSALSIVSVTNVAATSSTIVVTNGTGATMSTANITFTYLVLN
jgi:hypothetical protein